MPEPGVELIRQTLSGRLDLLPPALFGNDEPIVFLPPIPATEPTGEILFWATDPDEDRRPLAWSDGAALDWEATFRRLTHGLHLAQPLVAKLPFHPHRLPGFIRRAGRAVWAKGDSPGEGYPRWPKEPTPETWLAMGKACGLVEPGDDQATLCLSHDVDTAQGQKNAPALARAEEALGLRSAWFLPAANYKLDLGLWQDLADRGHEIACHGFNHDFKTPYLAPDKMEDRLKVSAEALNRFGRVGFRAPGFFRSAGFLAAVGRHFAYDSSIPDCRTAPRPNGCGLVRPFKIIDQPSGIESLTEIPISLPPEGELLAKGFSPDRIVDLWLGKADWIIALGGTVHVLTHPDPGFSDNPAMISLYSRFLGRLLDRPQPPDRRLPREAARMI